MSHAVDENEPACDLVEVDVLVQGQDDVQPELSEFGDGMAEHYDQDEHAGEVQALSWRSK